MIALLRRGWHTYVGNAAAVRDFRSQLRGNKAIWIWGAYLGLLIALCGLAYAGIVNQSSQSISSLQEQLQNFYRTVMAMLGAVIAMAAPALTAASITIERQRRSLDLVFSAPVSPRYLLVGKLIGGFRYLLMLLVLALPVTSVCVVMGGATWGDVVSAFLVLMSNGIILMAIGLLVSSLSPTTISAIIGTYLATIAYLVVSSFFALALAVPMMASMAGGRTNEAIWTATLSPFGAAFSAPTFTRVGSFEVPNWIFGLVFSLAISRLLLAGAGSALSPYGSAETKILRLQGWIVTLVLGFLISVPLGAVATMVTGGGVRAGGGSNDYAAGLVVGAGLASLFFLMPHLVCHGRDAELKYRNDGLFSWRNTLKGTPSGALPYILGLVAISILSVALGFRHASGKWAGAEFWSLSIWALGYLVMWWGLGRYVSSFRLGLRAARAALMAVMIVLLAIPIPILTMISAAQGYSSDATLVWMFHPLFPLSPDGSKVGWIYGIAGAVVGISLAFSGEANLRRPSLR